jgi:hypothetical protein
MKAFAEFINAKGEPQLGSDAVFKLDGRNTLPTWKHDAARQLYRLQSIHSNWVGFRIMLGDLRSSRQVYQYIKEAQKNQHGHP